MFIQPGEICAVYLHIDRIDFRKSINGLGCEVTLSFGDRSSGKNLFVFTNRQNNKIRILYWDDTGYALWHKALDADRFKWPSNSGAATLKITTDQLKWLLSGLSIERVKAHKKIDEARQFY